MMVAYIILRDRLPNVDFDHSALVKIHDTKQFGVAHRFPVTHRITTRYPALTFRGMATQEDMKICCLHIIPESQRQYRYA